MNYKSRPLRLTISVVGLLLLMNLAVCSPALAHVRHVYRVRTKRVVNRPRKRLAKGRRTRRHVSRKARPRRLPASVVRNRYYGYSEKYRRNLKVNAAKSYRTYHEVKGNEKVWFKHFLYLNYLKYAHHSKKYRYGDPQSITISPNGNLYVLFNVWHKNGHVNQIFEYNMWNQRLIKVGRRFNGGHGQGLSYNYGTHQLWLCINLYRYKKSPRGIVNKSLRLVKISQRTLRPTGSVVRINFHRKFGDNFTVDRSGQYWNVAPSYSHHDRSAPFGSLQIFRGRGKRVRMVNDILHGPGTLIQNLTYNPYNNRLYVIGNGIIMSFPINRINHLTNRDVKVSIMDHHSEFEDLGFWNHRAYLLVHPNRILISTKSF